MTPRTDTRRRRLRGWRSFGFGRVRCAGRPLGAFVDDPGAGAGGFDRRPASGIGSGVCVGAYLDGAVDQACGGS
ncbi:hypothetical protein [Gordonia crocea]|uniref:hypothetical protein n=1 Tax=Gordonia crocea TaxID=589162 RepID=UPI00137A554F|nr:hypothetical protein [Gordonia crocea]